MFLWYVPWLIQRQNDNVTYEYVHVVEEGTALTRQTLAKD